MCTHVGDTFPKFQLKLIKLGCGLHFLCDSSCAQLLIVTTSNSTAGLRNETSSDTLSRDLLGTTIVTSSSKLCQSGSGGRPVDHVDLQFTAISSSRANSTNLRSGGMPTESARSSGTSSYVFRAQRPYMGTHIRSEMRNLSNQGPFNEESAELEPKKCGLDSDL